MKKMLSVFFFVVFFATMNARNEQKNLTIVSIKEDVYQEIDLFLQKTFPKPKSQKKISAKKIRKLFTQNIQILWQTLNHHFPAIPSHVVENILETYTNYKIDFIYEKKTSALSRLWWCDCSEAIEKLRFYLIFHFLSEVTNKKKNKNKRFIYTSFGTGSLLQDYLIIIGLISLGFKNLTINLIDPLYLNHNKTNGYLNRFEDEALALDALYAFKNELLYDYKNSIHIFTDAYDFLEKWDKRPTDALLLVDPPHHKNLKWKNQDYNIKSNRYNFYFCLKNTPKSEQIVHLNKKKTLSVKHRHVTSLYVFLPHDGNPQMLYDPQTKVIIVPLIKKLLKSKYNMTNKKESLATLLQEIKEFTYSFNEKQKKIDPSWDNEIYLLFQSIHNPYYAFYELSKKITHQNTHTYTLKKNLFHDCVNLELKQIPQHYKEYKTKLPAQLNYRYLYEPQLFEDYEQQNYYKTNFF